ncbi:hypothetical protein LNQ03_00805 [Klebsiella pneumoniae subsp. pneumoniae]|nr:hypothetical protein [Klebsiella pneumoniae subsp. pneumoniae]
MKQLTAQVKRKIPEAARYVHWGATSQGRHRHRTAVLQLRGGAGCR